MAKIKHQINRPVALKQGMTNMVETELVTSSPASWERPYAEGVEHSFQCMRVQKSLVAGWVQFYVREQGVKSGREVSMLLDANQVTELASLLLALPSVAK